MSGSRTGGTWLVARTACAVAFAAALGWAAPPTAAAAAPNPQTCTGALPGGLPPAVPGPLRYGINPRVQAGQVGPVPSTAVPADPAQQLAALKTLSQGRPFVLRLNRLFWPEPPGQRARLDEDVQRYSAAGYLLELQLRYHPAGSAPDPAAFAAWAAGIAHRYDANPALVSLQVTNEVNFAVSQDSSDGAFTGARDALIQGVEQVKQQVSSDGASRVKVGFNWFYRTDGNSEKGFWGYLASQGGATFAAALDWVGLDAYPGTFFPPAEPAPGGYYGGMVNALSVLHDCFMPYGGVAGKPIYIEETGYPTDLALRSEANQLVALNELAGAARDYAGRYNVTDFRWFNLRDADSSSANFQQHFGLLNSDYSRKPAFCAYRRVVTGRTDCPVDVVTVTQASPGAAPGAAGRSLPLTATRPVRPAALPALAVVAAALLLVAGHAHTWGQVRRIKR